MRRAPATSPVSPPDSVLASLGPRPPVGSDAEGDRRSEVDLSRIVDLLRAIRHAPDSAELARSLWVGAQQAFRVPFAALLLPFGEVGFAEPQRRVQPLAPTSRLLALVAASHEPVPLAPAAASAASILPRADREWLATTGARLLSSVLSGTGELVGVLALSGRGASGELDGEDRQLLAAVAQSTGVAIDLLALRERFPPGRSAERPASECVECGRLHETVLFECPSCFSRAIVPALVPWSLADRYRFRQRVGSGASGVVYRAHDSWLGRDIAVKTLARLTPAEAMELRREARVLASMSHPHLAVVHGLEVWRGTPLMLLEDLPNGTLNERIGRQVLSPGWVLELGRVVAGALAHLHRRNVLHRDVKPGHIGFDAEDRPKLIDFGLASWEDSRWEGRGEPLSGSAIGWGGDASLGRLGTISYLSPETVRGEAPTVAVDLWGLSVVLWEALAGRRAFVGRTVEELMQRIVRGRRPRPLRPLAPALIALFADLLAVDPQRRPGTAAEMAARLQVAADALGTA